MEQVKGGGGKEKNKRRTKQKTTIAKRHRLLVENVSWTTTIMGKVTTTKGVLTKMGTSVLREAGSRDERERRV